MNPESSAQAARLSRRQMLHTLSIGGAGAAFDWHVPAFAAQAAAAAGTPAFAALNRFPRMVQEFFVARENALPPAAAGTARGAEDEGRRGGVRADGPREDPCSRSGRSRRRRRSTRASRSRPSGMPTRSRTSSSRAGRGFSSRRTSISPRDGASRCRAWWARAGIRRTARRSRRISRSARGSRGWATSC